MWCARASGAMSRARVVCKRRGEWMQRLDLVIQRQEVRGRVRVYWKGDVGKRGKGDGTWMTRWVVVVLRYRRRRGDGKWFFRYTCCGSR